jgi:hypothetical protein
VLSYAASYSSLANYRNAKLDKLVNTTLHAKPSQKRSARDAFAKYTAKQVPYLWMPDEVGAFGAGNAGTLVDKNIGGFTVNTFELQRLEDWYLTKQLRIITLQSDITAR